MDCQVSHKSLVAARIGTSQSGRLRQRPSATRAARARSCSSPAGCPRECRRLISREMRVADETRQKNAWPLIFTYRGNVFGHRYIASVSAVSRVLGIQEDDGIWLSEVQPGGVAAGGPMFGNLARPTARRSSVSWQTSHRRLATLPHSTWKPPGCWRIAMTRRSRTGRPP